MSSYWKRERTIGDIWGADALFWLIVDANWAPHEQNRLVRLWKEATGG